MEKLALIKLALTNARIKSISAKKSKPINHTTIRLYPHTPLPVEPLTPARPLL